MTPKSIVRPTSGTDVRYDMGLRTDTGYAIRRLQFAMLYIRNILVILRKAI